jgi:putative ABC transport system permease protein
MNLRRFSNRSRKDQDFAKEIESHLAHEEDANLARGLSREQARRQAFLRFGNPRTVREREWHYRSFPWISDLKRDFSLAVRTFAKTPGFIAIAVLVIAVGIGVNTAVFSVINAVLLKPLTYPNPQELVSFTKYRSTRIIPGRQHTQVQSVAPANEHLPEGCRI